MDVKLSAIAVSTIAVSSVALYVRSGFWMRQPIRHIYDYACGQIQVKEWTKYCNFSVSTFKYADEPVEALVEYVRSNSPGYLNLQQVRAYLPGSCISVYVDNTIQGAIISRPVHFALDAVELPAMINEYWVGDTQEIREKLLCTHEYNRNSTSFFATDVAIPLLIPILSYPIYWVNTNKYRKYKASATRLNASSILTVRRMLVTSAFKCKIAPSMERFIELIECKVLSVFYVAQCIFFFKNTMSVEKTKSVLDLVCVIGNTEMAYRAFSTLMFEIKDIYGFVRIHGLSNYEMVNRKIPDKTTYRFIYAYNYYAPRMQGKDCLFI